MKISRCKFLMTTSDLANIYSNYTALLAVNFARAVLLFINYQTRKKRQHLCCKLDIGRAVIGCPSIYRALIGCSSKKRAFRWHKNINRGIRFILVYSIFSRDQESAVYAPYARTNLGISSSIWFQMLRSLPILILLLALASAIKPQELSIEDIVKGTMQVIKLYRQQMAKSCIL